MCIENRVSVPITVSNINIQKICYYVITGYHGNLLLARFESTYSLIWSGGVRMVGSPWWKFSIWNGSWRANQSDSSMEISITLRNGLGNGLRIG